MRTKKCMKCGAENLLKNKTCYNCGERIGAGQALKYIIYAILLLLFMGFMASHHH